MAAIKTLYQGDSLSIGFSFGTYDVSRIENAYVYINEQLYPSSLEGSILRCVLKSEDTKRLYGTLPLMVVIDDSIFGIRKTIVGNISFISSSTINDTSINQGYNISVTMTINEESTAVCVELIEAFRGLSAYDIYVKYTTDDPVLTESEWNTAVNAAKESTEASAAAALISEQNAKASELAAEGFKNTAGQQATIATNKALESFNSAAAALVSEQHAKTSEDNAKGSETASGISASNAAGSAITAGQQAGIATNKAGEALGYRNEAEGFKTTAGQQATISTDKAGEALQSAQNASNSAQEALGYKNTAEQLVSQLSAVVEMIAHNTTAPSPVIPSGATKTYEFSSGGTVSWLDNQVVEKGDKVTVLFTAPSTYTRTYQNVVSRKVDDTQIVQVTGTSETNIISQKIISEKLATQMDYNMLVTLMTDADNIWGFMWSNEQSDDRVTFINDLPAIYTQDYAPVGSKRAAYLNKIRPVEVNPTTNVVNKLSDNVTLLADGVTPSHVADPAWLQFSVIPKIYFKYKYYNGSHTILFSETPQFGFTLYDIRLRARYRGTTGSGKLLSYANNQNPTVSQSLITNQSQARATASWLDVNDYYTYFLQTMLMTADCGRFNHQYYWVGATAASTTYAASIPCGKTNGMTTASGNGTVYNISGSNVTPFRWRFIENPYGGIWDELIGLYIVHDLNEVKQRAFATMNRNLFTTNNDYSQYTLLGEFNRTYGWVKEWLGGTILPSSIGGSSTLYKCDYNYNNEGTAAFVNTVLSGGRSIDGSRAGSFFLYSDWAASDAIVYVGASLTVTELPEAIKNQVL